jgi:thiopurine S-methyltransferase
LPKPPNVRPPMADAKFWHERWKTNEIGFHEGRANALLVKYFNRLELRKGARVFVPLCGKTRDISWLLSKGCLVVGAELSEIAIRQLFSELGLKPNIAGAKSSALKQYSAKNVEVFVGNIFDVSRAKVGTVDAIYDRAALVALPPAVRKRYTAHLRRITNTAPQMLVSFEYDQSVFQGPPFSIINPELVRHYGKHYDLVLLSSDAMPDGLKGKWPATENLWLLQRK